MMLTIFYIAGFQIALAILLLLVSAAKNHWNWHPEVARKLVHISMGVACLMFPIMFDSIWPVWVNVLLSTSILTIVKVSQKGHALMGTALHSVERRSKGEVWYAFAIGIVFTLAFMEGTMVLYCIPILILAFSDAAAALIGVKYGQLRFTASDSTKSIEGSTAFTITCFFLVAFPLAVVSDASPLKVLLVSLIISLVIMLIEGASWKGIDNILIPVGAFFMLRNYLDYSEIQLVLHISVLVSIIVLFVWMRKRTLLDGSGLLGVILLCFLHWSLAGIEWLYAPLIYFLLYNYFSKRRGQTERYIHDIKSVISITSAATIMFLCHLTWPNEFWLMGFCTAFATQLMLTGMARRSHFIPEHSHAYNGLLAWIQGVFYILLPCILILWLLQYHFLVQWFAYSALGMMICLGIFVHWQPSIRQLPRNRARWCRQALVGSIPVLFSMTGTMGLTII